MARQHVHNRRAGRGGGGSSWISYSDIMAALVLMFVLFLVYSLYNYSNTIRIQTDQLDAQQRALDNLSDELSQYEGVLIIMQQQLDSTSAALAEREEMLSAQTIILIGKQEELDQAEETLRVQQAYIDQLIIQLQDRERLIAEQQDELQRQAAAMADLVGVRADIIQALSRAMQSHDLHVDVDLQSGNITMEASVLFPRSDYHISAVGADNLRRFFPIYIEVLLQPEYRDYIGAVIIEGHTDTDGDYDTNMQLSLNRANAVADLCMDLVSEPYRSLLQPLLTVQGRSEADPIIINGVEDKDASRRVIFKFSLRDTDMVQQLVHLLQQTYGTGSGSN